MTKGEDTRRAILDAGLKMASQLGLESVTIGGLARAAGMSKSGLFAHFHSKENLQIEILDHAGREFTEHEAVARKLQTKVYFAEPYQAWQRGLNENTNGLIRQYLPKRQSMVQLTQQACNAIARRLNRRPRKRLGYRTPEECYVP